MTLQEALRAIRFAVNRLILRLPEASEAAQRLDTLAEELDQIASLPPFSEAR